MKTKLMILIGTTLMAVGIAKAQLQMVYDPFTGDFRYIDVNVDSDGDVHAFDLDRGLPLDGNVDSDGDGYLYSPYEDHPLNLNLDMEDYN